MTPPTSELVNATLALPSMIVPLDSFHAANAFCMTYVDRTAIPTVLPELMQATGQSPDTKASPVSDCVVAIRLGVEQPLGLTSRTGALTLPGIDRMNIKQTELAFRGPGL